MEYTNSGLVGSLEPIERLTDAYSNNTEDRSNLVKAQLLGNPFDIKLPKKSDTISNNNKIINSYFKSIGVEINTDPDYKNDFDNIEKLSDEDIESMLNEYTNNKD
ncbi:hypothetical protein FPHOBKDP_00181 [Listeria phage LPJP1]|nr:hypothetical protein FPHOBKDP_00181 [Listeria phage LPJP1]